MMDMSHDMIQLCKKSEQDDDIETVYVVGDEEFSPMEKRLHTWIILLCCYICLLFVNLWHLLHMHVKFSGSGNQLLGSTLDQWSSRSNDSGKFIMLLFTVKGSLTYDYSSWTLNVHQQLYTNRIWCFGKDTAVCVFSFTSFIACHI